MKADKALLEAVLEPRKPGALENIAEACAAGANPDGIVPECSTSYGFVRGGSTLLTHSVHEAASRAVAKLLECGANPNLADNNGWTPWMASTMADESKRSRIQKQLSKSGANKNGEHIGSLVRAIANGDVKQAISLLSSDDDLQIISTFRVDLLDLQVRRSQTPMLEFLLERGMEAQDDYLSTAVYAKDLPGVELLLRFGVAPERPREQETPLMTAASQGQLAIVQRLVAAGADVNRFAHGNIEWTAAAYARKAGHTEIAQWLDSQMQESVLEQQAAVRQARNPKYQVFYDKGTCSDELSTDEIVVVLERWDAAFGIKVSDVRPDGVTLEFSTQPAPFDAFYEELLKLCPDIGEEDEEDLEEELADSHQLILWWD